MQRTNKYLVDILQSIELIEAFTSATSSFEDFSSDLKTRSAVERQLSIIGEAFTKIRKEDTVTLSNSKEIIGFRNRLIHNYDGIDESIVWTIVIKHLPILKSEVVQILA